MAPRWFDQKLTVGIAARYYGKANEQTIQEDYINGSEFELNTSHERTYYAIKKNRRN